MIARPTAIRARLTSWFAAAMAIVLILFGTGVFFLVKATRPGPAEACEGWP